MKTKCRDLCLPYQIIHLYIFFFSLILSDMLNICTSTNPIHICMDLEKEKKNTPKLYRSRKSCFSVQFFLFLASPSFWCRVFTVCLFFCVRNIFLICLVVYICNPPPKNVNNNNWKSCNEDTAVIFHFDKEIKLPFKVC